MDSFFFQMAKIHPRLENWTLAHVAVKFCQADMVVSFHNFSDNGHYGCTQFHVTENQKRSTKKKENPFNLNANPSTIKAKSKLFAQNQHEYNDHLQQQQPNNNYRRGRGFITRPHHVLVLDLVVVVVVKKLGTFSRTQQEERQGIQ